MFSHQTLADALRIRQAQINDIDLQVFVTSQPQLPFIRPAVRAFILSLRSVQPDQFTKQLHKFLLNDIVSMHLKRLAVETLAEMIPKQDDLTIVSMLSSRLPTIFSRFLERANGEDWFLFLHNNWLPTVNMPNIENSSTILRYFSRFLDGNEQCLITIWNRAFDEQWLPVSNLTWSISSALKNLKRWKISGISQCLEKLIDANKGGII